MFEEQISIYQSVKDNAGQVTTLQEFLTLGQRYAEVIRELREADEVRKAELKRTLPAATISGLFSPTRSNSNLQRHSTYICIDIDRKDNLNCQDWDNIKTKLASIKQVCYCSKSVGGAGYFVLIKLAYPARHREQFEALKRDFEKLGIVIDKSCKDVCRLRVVSYDEAPYINPEAPAYLGVYEPPKPQPKRMPKYLGDDVTERAVADLVGQIEAYKVDITDNYADWLAVGLALAGLGEAGRGYFHSVSSQCPKYRHDLCDNKFTELLNHRTGAKKIASFFWIAAQYGLKPNVRLYGNNAEQYRRNAPV